MGKLLSLLSGWKRIIFWALLQVPGLSAVPGAKGSLEKAMANPTKENIVEAALQIGLAIAMLHGAKKNVQ